MFKGDWDAGTHVNSRTESEETTAMGEDQFPVPSYFRLIYFPLLGLIAASLAGELAENLVRRDTLSIEQRNNGNAGKSAYTGVSRTQAQGL